LPFHRGESQLVRENILRYEGKTTDGFSFEKEKDMQRKEDGKEREKYNDRKRGWGRECARERERMRRKMGDRPHFCFPSEAN
jgi:hypothetical protein